MRQAYPYLQQLEEHHKRGECNYLHEHYDTYAFYPDFTQKNVLSMIRSSFIEGLNRRLKLPNIVVVLYSEQLLTEDPLYLPSELDRKLKWLIRELTSAIRIRKDFMPSKCYVMGEPRIMWVRAFQNSKRNSIPEENLLKFNNMLRRICMAKAIYTLPIISNKASGSRCFDFDNKTQIQAGFEDLWLDIIQGIKQHDKTDKCYEQKRIIDNASKSNRTGFVSPSKYEDDRGFINRDVHKSRSGKNEARNKPHYADDRLSGRVSRRKSPFRHRDHSREIYHANS